MKNLLGIPDISDLEDLSQETHISQHTLYKIFNKSDLFYKRVVIPKKSGGQRVLACPSFKLKAVQAWILRRILDKIPVQENVTAYIKCNISENAKRHIGNKFIMCLDIKDFFPSTRKDRVWDFFYNQLSYNRQVSYFFTKVCTYKGGLPQGGVTSPALSNILNAELDKLISKYCGLNNLTYTRYADDITISSNNKKKLYEARKEVESILEHFDYKLNTKKTRFLQLGQQRNITGLIYNDDEEIRIGRRKKQILRAKIHHLELQLNDQKEINQLYNHITGWMSFLKSVDKKTYDQLITYWNQVKQKKNRDDYVAATVEE